MIECISIDYFNIESLFFEMKIMIRDTARKFVSGNSNTIKKIKWVLKVPSGNKRKMEIPCLTDTNLLPKYHCHVFTIYSLEIISLLKIVRRVLYLIVNSGVLKYKTNTAMTDIYA